MRIINGIFILLCIGFFATIPAGAFAAVPAPSKQIFQKTLVALANNDRRANGVRTLTASPLLAAAAQKKANDMAANSYFSHTSPTGTSPWQWITKVGYRYTHAAENLAMNFDNPTTLEAAWMDSPEHRANIVRRVYTQVGVGIAHGTYQGKPVTFVVQLFATPA